MKVHVRTEMGNFFQAPLVPKGAPLVNALFRQRSCIENILRACLGLAPVNHMDLEHKMSVPSQWNKKVDQIANGDAN